MLICGMLVLGIILSSAVLGSHKQIKYAVARIIALYPHLPLVSASGALPLYIKYTLLVYVNC